MNTRVSISVALAVGAAMGLLFSHALPPAHAQTPAPHPSSDLAILALGNRVDALQQRIDVLQIQVNQLKANKAVMMGNTISPFYQPPPIPRQSNIPPAKIILLGQSAH